MELIVSPRHQGGNGNKIRDAEDEAKGKTDKTIEIPRDAIPRRRALVRADSSATIADDR